MIGYYTKFITKENDREALIKLLSAAADAMASIPECRVYIVNKDAEQSEITWVTEIWTSADAHDAALQTKEARELIPEALTLLTGRPEVITIEPLAGKGL